MALDHQDITSQILFFRSTVSLSTSASISVQISLASSLAAASVVFAVFTVASIVVGIAYQPDVSVHVFSSGHAEASA